MITKEKAIKITNGNSSLGDRFVVWVLSGRFEEYIKIAAKKGHNVVECKDTILHFNYAPALKKILEKNGFQCSYVCTDDYIHYTIKW